MEFGVYTFVETRRDSGSETPVANEQGENSENHAFLPQLAVKRRLFTTSSEKLCKRGDEK